MKYQVTMADTDPACFTITAHRQARWTPGWITTNRIVFPRTGVPQWKGVTR